MLNSILSLSTLLIGVAILLTGHGLQLALVPLRAEIMGWNNFAVGILGSAYFGGFLAGCISIPQLVGRIGHIRTFAALTALLTTSILALALNNAFALWFLLRIVTGVAIAGLYLVIESWLNEKTRNEVRGGVLALYTAIVLAGLAVGQLLLNVGSLQGQELIIMAAILITLAAIPICVTKSEQPAQIPSASFSPLLVLQTSRVASAGAVVAGMVTASYYSLGPVYGLQLGLNVTEVSLMMALGITGGAISLMPLGRLSDKINRRLVILIVMLTGTLVAGATLFLSFETVPYMMFLFGACVMPIYALSLAHASDNIAARSFLEVGTGLLVMNSIGAIIGPLAGAQLMQWYGPQGFFLFNAVILGTGALLVIVMIFLRNAPRDHFSEFQATTTAAAQGVLQMDPRTPEHLNPADLTKHSDLSHLADLADLAESDR